MTNPINLNLLASQVEQASTGIIAAYGTIPALEPRHTAAEVLYDVCGRKRSPATLRSFRMGIKPNNYGRKYPATPPTQEEVIALLGACPNNPAGRRVRALTALLYRSGVRVSEGLALEKPDLNPDAGTVFVRCGKGGKTRTVGMDPWGFEQVMPYLEWRYDRYPAGPVFCIVQGLTKGRAWSASAYRTQLRELAKVAGIERRLAPHQLRHAMACEMARESEPIYVVQRQLGHGSIATTATYLSGISNEETVRAVSNRPAPGALELVAA